MGIVKSGESSLILHSVNMIISGKKLRVDRKTIKLSMFFWTLRTLADNGILIIGFFNEVHALLWVIYSSIKN